MNKMLDSTPAITLIEPVTLYHQSDPDAPEIGECDLRGMPYKGHCWYYVYLHGAAETLNELIAEKRGFEWQPPDLFVADQPMPKQEGTYKAFLYCHPAIIVVRKRLGHLCGRVALVDDEEALAHVNKPEDWR